MPKRFTTQIARFHDALTGKGPLPVTSADARQALEEQVRVVRDVLEEIGAGAIPSILVLNQIDRLDVEAAQHLQALYPEAYLVSATTGQGIPALLERLEQEQERWRRKQAQAPSKDQVHVPEPEAGLSETFDEPEAVEQ